MISNEILIGLGGLVLSALTYFAGVKRTEKRHARADREARVRRVHERYMEFRRTNHTDGLDGLLKAGVAMLDSNDEVEELCSLIVSHGEKHPLGLNHNSALKNVDLPRLFQFAAEKRVNFYLTRIEEVIRDSGAQS